MMTSGRLSRRRAGLVAGGVVVLVVAVVTVFLVVRDRDGAPSGMAGRAQNVMPFDLNKTTHIFTKNATGGVESVVVKDQADTRDIDLIRSHLKDEAVSFARGDYSDPAKIHGMDMPGVHELEAGASRISVQYAERSDGAQITYSSSDPTLVEALHSWFDRQSADHGMPGMGG